MSEKKEYIERGAVNEKLSAMRQAMVRIYGNGNGNLSANAVDAMQTNINAIPAADVEPVVRAYWEWFCEVDSTTNGYEEDYGWRCSGCHAKLTDFIADGDVQDEYPIRTKHCPHCGAHMERSGSGE